MRSLLIAILLMSTLTVQAQFLGGHDRGNGGDVLVCYDSAGKITSAKFYDLFEAEVKFGMTLIPPQGNTIDEKVDSIISRVEKIDPSRAWAFRNWYKNFFQESKFIPGVELGDIPDQGDALWPVNCKIKQLVVQTDVKPPLNPHRYTFSQDLWNLLDDNSKVATIIHELIFREARTAGHKSSQAVRYLNGLFWADELNQLSLLDYQKLIIKDLNMIIVTDANGTLIIRGGSTEFVQSLKGLPFNLLGYKFEFDGNKYNPCNSVNESGICISSHNLINSLVSYYLPDTSEKSKIYVVMIKNGLIKIDGEFAINFLPIKTNHLTLISYDMWVASFSIYSQHYILNFNNSKIISGKLMLEDFNDINLELNSTVQIETKEASYHNKIKTTFTPDKTIEINSNFICRSGQKFVVEDGSSISCILDKNAVFKRRNSNNAISVKAGTRVLVNSKLELIKIQ